MKMLKGLIIDTSGKEGIIAISENSILLDYEILKDNYTLSLNFLSSLQSLLNRLTLDLKDIDYISTGIGPGSYTGTRIGSCFGKTFAFALNIPLLGFLSPLLFLPDDSGKFCIIFYNKQNYFLIKGLKKEFHLEKISIEQNISSEHLSPYLQEMNFIVCDPSILLDQHSKNCKLIIPKMNEKLIVAYAFQKFSNNHYKQDHQNELAHIYIGKH